MWSLALVDWRWSWSWDNLYAGPEALRIQRRSEGIGGCGIAGWCRLWPWAGHCCSKPGSVVHARAAQITAKYEWRGGRSLRAFWIHKLLSNRQPSAAHDHDADKRGFWFIMIWRSNESRIAPGLRSSTTRLWAPQITSLSFSLWITLS
jgi:hypothetical protein